VVRSKAGAREGALEPEPAGAGVRGAAGGLEESGRVSMTLGSSCSWVEGLAGGRGGSKGVTSSGSVPRGRKQPGRAIPVTGRVVCVAVGTLGGRSNTPVENRPQIALHRAGRVPTSVFRLGVVAWAEWVDHGALAPGFDMAKLPAVAALGRGGRWVGSLNHTVAAIKEKRGRINHSVSMVRGDMDHNGASPLAVRG